MKRRRSALRRRYGHAGGSSRYRVRYVGDAGPVSASRSFTSMLAALKFMRDELRGNPDVGVKVGLALQNRLAAGEPWHWISAADTDRYAKQMNIKGWRPLA